MLHISKKGLGVFNENDGFLPRTHHARRELAILQSSVLGMRWPPSLRKLRNPKPRWRYPVLLPTLS